MGKKRKKGNDENMRGTRRKWGRETRRGKGMVKEIGGTAKGQRNAQTMVKGKLKGGRTRN